MAGTGSGPVSKPEFEPRFRTYDGDDALGFVIDLNLNRRQLTLSQRAMVAAEIATLAQGARTDLSEISEMSQPKAAKLLGVSVDSIGFGRRVLESGDAELIDLVKTDKIAVSLAAKLAEDAPEFRQSALAKIRAGERPAMAVKMTRQEEGFEARGDEVDKLPPCEAGDDIEALLEGDADGERKWFGAIGSGNDEWHTPAPYIARVQAVLGTIDLDPASNDIAQRTVKAERYFTKADDGLAHEWHARTVFLNPPYSRNLMPAFVSKLVAEFKAARVESAILLTNNYTDTAWFHEAFSVCSAICFTRGRIRFESPEQEGAAPTQGQAFFYFGDDIDAFIAAFEPIGTVIPFHDRLPLAVLRERALDIFKTAAELSHDLQSAPECERVELERRTKRMLLAFRKNSAAIMTARAAAPAPAAPEVTILERRRAALARANALGDHELAEQIDKNDISVENAEKELAKREALAEAAEVAA